MQAITIMNRVVITVRRDAPVLEAVDLMLAHRVSGLPVLDEQGRLAGIITEGDLLRRSETCTERQHSWWWGWLHGAGAQAGAYVRSHAGTVADLMSPVVLSVDEDAPLEDIVDLMEQRRIKRVPVLRNGALVGVVSRSDLLRALADAMRAAPAADGTPDTMLASRLTEELNRQDWFRRGLIRIAVQDGVVRLSGIYTDARERDAIRVAAENVAGVTRVRDEMEFFDPDRGLVYG